VRKASGIPQEDNSLGGYAARGGASPSVSGQRKPEAFRTRGG